MRSRLIGATASALALTAAVAACSSSSSSTPSSTSSSTAGSSSSSSPASAASKTLVVETAFSLKTLDPARMFETTGELIDHALYDTLLTYKGADTTKLIPDIASSYTASADAKTYTFTLDPKATFADGTKVTAADVVFSLNRVKNIEGNPSFLMTDITATAKGTGTVVLTSSVANTAIPAILTNPALGIVEQKAVVADGGSDAANASTADKAETKLNTKSEGAGPYTLTSYSTTTQVTLTANPNYWGTKPAYSSIVIKNAEANVQKLDVLKGESQIAVDLSPAQAKGMSGVQVVNGASANMIFLFLNENPKISTVTSNKDFQQAVRYGIDYSSLIQLAGTGAVQGAGIVPSVFSGALPASDEIKTDLAKAKSYLAKSGVKDPSIDISYPAGLPVNGVVLDNVAARLQQNLAAVGIKATLKGSSVQIALAAYRAGTEAVGLWYWGPDFPDPSDYLNFLPGAEVGLRAGWVKGADPSLEALGTQASTTINASARNALYVKLQQQLNTDGPFIPLIQPAQILVAGTSVKNVASNPLWLVNLTELG
jgi:peptide/nickel transport system substrate-binding protein